MKKIVSARFDDGIEREVNDAFLREYLEDRALEEARRVLFSAVNPWEFKGMVKATQAVLQEEKSETNRASASGPHKTVTKEMLIAFKDQYNSRYPDAKRGWIGAACLEFDITQKTLNKRLKD